MDFFLLGSDERVAGYSGGWPQVVLDAYDDMRVDKAREAIVYEHVIWTNMRRIVGNICLFEF